MNFLTWKFVAEAEKVVALPVKFANPGKERQDFVRSGSKCTFFLCIKDESFRSFILQIYSRYIRLGCHHESHFANKRVVFRRLRVLQSLCSRLSSATCSR